MKSFLSITRSVFASITMLAFIPSVFATDFFATPAGAGAQDGSSWANAYAQPQIQTAINNLQAGDTLNLGSGTYTLTALNITGSGTAGNFKTIQGVDTGGGRPLFQGSFNVSNDANGARFIYVPGAAHYWAFKNLSFKNYPWVFSLALVSTGDDTLRSNFVFEDLSFDTIEDAIRLYNINNVEVTNCTAIRYTKKAFRFGDHTSFVTFTNCFADCTGGDPAWVAKAIPVGFGGDDTAREPIIHDITLIDCVARNHGYPQGSSNYWQGDGFSSERGTYNLTYIRCKAYDNRDGGFDNKATNILYQDCVSVGNSRGYRHWGDAGRMINCVAAYNIKWGGTGSSYGVWVSGNGGEITIDFSTLHHSATSITAESGATVFANDSILSHDNAGGSLISGPVTLNNTVSYRPGTGVDPAYIAPDPAWRGEPLNVMDSQTYGLTKGYNSGRVDETPNAAPTLGIAATPLSGTAPLTVTFAASAADSDGFIVSHLWTFGDGQTSTEVNPTVTYGSPGTFTATCRVTDNRGAQATDSVVITAGVPTTPVELRIESGSTSAYTDTLGRVWSADFGYGSGGGIADRGAIEIAGTDDDRLYQTERWGVSNYAFLIANGTYEVRLHFAETYTGITAAGQRVFSVTVEDTAPAGWTNIDVFAEAGGHNIALVKSGVVTIVDNIFDLEFTASADSAMINAIELIPTTSGDLPPTPPAGLAASDITPYAFTLSWSPTTDDVGVVDYQVLRNGTVIGTTAGTSFALSGLSPYTSYSMTVRARDTAGNGSAPSAPLIVKTLNDGTVGGDIIIDNADALGVTFTGAWPTSTFNSGYYGTNYSHDNNGAKGTKSVRFTPDFPEAGTYTVYLYWTADNNRASNVPVDITHAGGTTTVVVNQRNNNATWFPLGTFAMAAGTANNVLLRNDGTNGFVIADAVRFLRGTADTEAPSVPTGLAASNVTTDSFTLSWTASTDNVGIAGYDVFLDGALFTTATNTTAAIANLSPETSYSATVRARDTSGNVSAPGTPLSVTTMAEPPPVDFAIIIDNAASSGVTVTGSWTTGTTNANYYGSNYLHDQNDGKGTRSVRFTPDIPSPAQVTVSVYWPIGGSGRATNVPIDIVHAGGTTTHVVDQQLDGATWVELGTFAFNADTAGSVLIRNTDTNGFVVADAVRFAGSISGGGDDTEPPSMPGGLAADSITSSGFSLSWEESIDDVGVVGYEVFLDGVSVALSANTSTSLTGLSPNTTYSVTVRASDAAGNASPASAPLSVTTASAPGGGGGNGAVISVNLTNGSANSLEPADVVGAVPVANWNNTASANQTLSNVIDNSGAATTADLSFGNTSFGYVNNTPELPDPMTDDAKMMRSQRAQSNSGSMSMVAAQVPYAAYDVYVYWGGRTPQETVPLTMTVNFQLSDGSAWVTNATKYIRDTNRVWDGTYDESTAATAADAVDGQEYVVFRNVSAPTFRLAVTSGVRTGICGVQIVEHGPVGPAVPVITSATSAAGTFGAPFLHEITATESPTTFDATGLPAGLMIDNNTGVISGTPGVTGSFAVELSATNAGGTGTATLDLVIAPAAQTITFPNPGAKTFGDAPFALAATASSGLPVTYVVTSGPAEVSGDTVTIIGAGTVAITATQAGNADYLPAEPVAVSFEVVPVSQTITFPNPGPHMFGDPPITLTASASSGLPVAYTVTSGPAELNGDTVTITGAGTIAIAATQAGDANTLAADPVTVSFTVAPAAAQITLGDLWQRYDGQPRSVPVTTDPSGLDVTITYDGGSTPPVYPGTYAVEAVIDDPNYTGAASDTLIVTITALVRHAPTINGGLDGSVQVLAAESVTLNSSAYVSGDLLLPGSPGLQLNGQPTFVGTIDGPGDVAPSHHVVTLNSGSVLRYLVRRIDPLALPMVNAPPAPTGTRNVVLNSANESAGDFTTLRNLTLNSGAGVHVVPPGTYGSFTANSGSGFVLGIADATEPAIYNLQGLTLNGNGVQLQIVGPVILTLAQGANINGGIGTADAPEWLSLRIASGGLTLNSTATLHGFVAAPNGTVTINGPATLIGGVASDRLIINGSGLLASATP